MKKNIIYLVIQFSLFSNLSASELDNFSYRYKPLKDSRAAINQKANEIVQRVVNKINRKRSGCREKELYRQLRKPFNIILKKSELVYWVEHNDKIEKFHPKAKNSIYKDWSVRESPAIRVYSKFVPIVMGPELNFGGHRIGLDKFEHMFLYGYQNFESFYLKKKGIYEILIKGFKEEYGYLGAGGTGVMSYGDLSADFNGMRFWNNFLKKRPDVLALYGYIKKVPGPYVICENNRWKVNEEINFGDYIDDSMDEAINCSKFKKASMAKKVKNYLKNLEKKYKKRFTCPINPRSLKKMYKKYGRFAKYILNPDGHQAVPAKKDRKIYMDLKGLK